MILRREFKFGTVIGILLCSFFALSIQAQNTIRVTSLSGGAGTEAEVKITLSNANPAVALQMQIPLGDQLKYVANSCVLSDARIAGHVVTATVTNQVLKIISYSGSLSSYKGTEGEILSFRVTLGKVPGDYPLTLESCKLSDASGVALPLTVESGSLTILAPSISLNTTAIDFGRVPIREEHSQSFTINNPGNLPLTLSKATFSNVVFTTSLTFPQTILPGGSLSVPVLLNTTVGAVLDETVTLTSDASVLPVQKVTIKANAYSVNELYIGSVSGIADAEVTVTLSMNNMVDVCGFQCVLPLPSQLEYVEGSLALTSRKGDHTVTATFAEGKLTLLAYSVTNSSFSGVNGDLATFKLKLKGSQGYYALSPSKVVLSDATGVNVLSDVFSGSVTISSPSMYMQSSSIDMGRVPVTGEAYQDFTISNWGAVPLEVSSVVFTHTAFSIKQTLPLVVPSYESRSLRLYFKQQVAGKASGLMKLYTNDPNNRLVSVTVSGESFEPNLISIPAIQVDPDQSPRIAIDLNNYSEVSAVQFDLHYPSASLSIDKTKAALTDRSNGHIATVSAMNDSTLRVIVFSMTNQLIKGNSGALLTLPFSLKSATLTGSYALRVDRLVISNLKGVNVASSLTAAQTVSVVTPTITIPSYSVGFPVSYVGQMSAASVIITKNGTSDLVIENASLNNGLFSVNTLLPLTIKGGSSAELTLHFTGSEAGAQTGNLVLTTNNPIEPQMRFNLEAIVGQRPLTVDEAWFASQPEGLVYVGDVAYKYKGDSTAPASFAWQDVTSAIDGSAFMDCAGLTTLSIPTGVTSVGDLAFYRCSNLATVMIAPTVTSLGYSAFAGCTSLQKIHSLNAVPPAVTADCFDGVNLSACVLIVPAGYRAAYEYAAVWKEFGHIVEEAPTFLVDTIWYTKCSDSISVCVSGYGNFRSGIVEIPSTVNYLGVDYPVSAIRGRAFKNFTELTAVTIPASVTSIGDEAFYHCTGLNKLTSQGTVPPLLGANLFYDVNKSAAVLFVPSTAISTYASTPVWNEFSNLFPEGAVTEFVVTVTEAGTLQSALGEADLNYVVNLTISGPLNGTDIALIRDQMPRLRSLDMGAASIVSGGNPYLWGYLTTSDNEIGQYMFYNLPIASVVLPKNVTAIRYGALQSCYNLTAVTLPSGISSMEGYILSSCSSLASVTIPSGITSIPDGMFQSCGNLSSVAIPSTVTSIGSWAFGYCYNLSAITIPSTVSYVGDYAFYNCSSFSSVTIPSSVSSIGGWAFAYCHNLSAITIPSTIISMGANVFEGTSWYNNKPSGLVYAGSATYKYKGTMPSDCSILLEDGTKCIAGEAFNGCSGLASITIPLGVVSIGNNAFQSCSSLDSLTIPSGVTSIGDYTFYDCTSLDSVLIPESVTNIGYAAFYNCNALQKIRSLNKVPPYANYPFEGVNKTTCILYVPYRCSTDYSQANYWSEFANIVEEEGVFAKGDSNEDGMVNILDAVNVVDYILGNNPTPFHFKSSDVDGNGAINILDAVSVIDILLGNVSYSARAMGLQAASEPDLFEMDPLTIQAGETKSFALRLKNAASYTAFQLDLNLPEGLSIAKDDEGNNRIEMCEGRSNGSHVTGSNEIAAGKVRVTCYSMNNALYRGNEGDFISITVKADAFAQSNVAKLTVDNIHTITATREDNQPDACSGDVFIGKSITGLEGAEIASFEAYTKGGILYIQSPEDQELPLYSVDGRMIRMLSVKAGLNRFTDLDNGVYVVKGVKVIIK